MKLTALDKAAATLGYKLEPEAGFSISLGWHWEEWAWGWANMFSFLGFGALILGPLHVHVTWPAEWPTSQQSADEQDDDDDQDDENEEIAEAELDELLKALSAGDVERATEVVLSDQETLKKAA